MAIHASLSSTLIWIYHIHQKAKVRYVFTMARRIARKPSRECWKIPHMLGIGAWRLFVILGGRLCIDGISLQLGIATNWAPVSCCRGERFKDGTIKVICISTILWQYLNWEKYDLLILYLWANGKSWHYDGRPCSIVGVELHTTSSSAVITLLIIISHVLVPFFLWIILFFPLAQNLQVFTQFWIFSSCISCQALMY